HDFGEDDGLCSLVMEFVQGADLQKRLRGGAWEPEPALGVILQVCDALQYAHARGVIHRDIKPGNVLIDQAGRVKIVDFGLAKLVLPVGGIDDRMTATGQVLGTPRYMAPEQIESPRSVDHRADIYAVGLLLYELLTGDVPFGRYELLSERIGTCESLDEILARCLARDPAARYQSIRRLLKDLSEFAEEQYEVVSPARAVLEDDSQTFEPDEEAESSESSGEMGDWSSLGYLAMLFGFHVIYHNLLGAWTPGPARLAVSLVVCAPVVFFVAWLSARSRDWVWLYAATTLPYLVW
ncbi:serine/threonine-protein kinase, partial [Singulisphaera rosea]